MSKIKILYDVFKTLKDKESFNGDVKIEAIMNDKKVFDLSNEFSTNKETGLTKAKVSTEVDYEDNRLKHESTTEFNLKDHVHQHGGHGMWMHGNHHGCANGGNLKNKLSHVTFALGVLNNIKQEEDGDKTLLSLDLKEIIHEAKEMHPALHDRSCEEMKENKSPHHAIVKKLMEMEANDATLKVWINKSNEVEKVEILANGNKNVTVENQCSASFKLLLKLAL
ncbi:hypothetical protein G9F72_004360 [Clostridium estertheticum]|uniref:hypothetical protein n=1 Tax=Clostridium estertheticum TaxID=238834 RepID=UPI00165213DE|nr:hypothetical protein [Clostridium estertheticum]MBZ9685584.1 hypothetical protein [Clostridium estertheticum]